MIKSLRIAFQLDQYDYWELDWRLKSYLTARVKPFICVLARPLRLMFLRCTHRQEKSAAFRRKNPLFGRQELSAR
jgi:hypothetical protein